MQVKDIFNTVKQRKPTLHGIDKLKKFAVLLPFIQEAEEPCLLFEVRAKHLRCQPGDVCFPGGKIEPFDRHAMETAIRETSEELGIPAEAIHHVHPIDYLITPYGTMIYPFIGIIEANTLFHPNEDEVSEMFTVPFSFFLNTEPKVYEVQFQAVPDENFPFEHIYGGKQYRFRSAKTKQFFYYYQDKVIWGLTAKLIYNFADYVKSHPSE